MSIKTHPGPFRSAQLARLAGISTDTLRHYERKGLLAPRRLPNGYREYPPEALGRVRLVQHALSVGFTLDELARVLTIRDRGGAPCREVRALASAKLKSLGEQIRDLAALQNQLRALLKEWDARLARTPKGAQALLLDRWPGKPAGARTPRADANLSASQNRSRRRIRKPS